MEKLIVGHISNQSHAVFTPMETFATGTLMKLDLNFDSYGESFLHVQALRKTAKPLVRCLCAAEHFNVLQSYTTEKSESDKLSQQVFNTQSQSTK